MEIQVRDKYISDASRPITTKPSRNMEEGGDNLLITNQQRVQPSPTTAFASPKSPPHLSGSNLSRSESYTQSTATKNPSPTLPTRIKSSHLRKSLDIEKTIEMYDGPYSNVQQQQPPHSFSNEEIILQRNALLRSMPRIEGTGSRQRTISSPSILSSTDDFEPVNRSSPNSSVDSAASNELSKRPRRRFSHQSPFLDVADYRVLRSGRASGSDADSLSSVQDEPLRISSGQSFTHGPSPSSSMMSSGSDRERKRGFLGDWPEVVGFEPEPKLEMELPTYTSFSFLGVHASLAFFSIIGMLIRDGLSAASAQTIPQQPNSVLYATFVGCTIYGATSRRQISIETKSYALYVGMSTGLCGSITSFSSWMIDANHALVNWPDAASSYQGTGYMSQVIAMFTILFVGLAAAKGGLAFGRTLAMAWTNQWNIVIEQMQVPEPALRSPSSSDYFAAASAIALMLVTVTSFAFAGESQRAIACATAPFGTFLRYQLAKRLDGKRWNWLPRGTLTANITGCAVLALLKIGVHQPSTSELTKELLSGIGLGFVGCFTTVSTFILELDKMAAWPRRSLAYGFISIVGAQVLLLIINGIYLSFET